MNKQQSNNMPDNTLPISNQVYLQLCNTLKNNSNLIEIYLQRNYIGSFNSLEEVCDVFYSIHKEVSPLVDYNGLITKLLSNEDVLIIEDKESYEYVVFKRYI
jgi:hypothetical protein